MPNWVADQGKHPRFSADQQFTPPPQDSHVRQSATAFEEAEV
jgi:hypothetical protein